MCILHILNDQCQVHYSTMSPQGYFVKLSKEKHGSRVVDCCWKHTELKDKQLIVNELLKGEKELADNYYGKFVLRNCNIEYYKKKGDVTEGNFNSKEKVKKMFSDIIDRPTKLESQRAHKKRKSSTRHDVQTSEHNKELKALGFVVKKKRLFDDEVSYTVSFVLHMFTVVFYLHFSLMKN